MNSSYFDPQRAYSQMSTPYWSPSTSSLPPSPLTQTPNFSSSTLPNHQESSIAQTGQDEERSISFFNPFLLHSGYQIEKMGIDALSTLYSIANSNLADDVKENVVNSPFSSLLHHHQDALKINDEDFEEMKEKERSKNISSLHQSSEEIRGPRNQSVLITYKNGDRKRVHDKLRIKITEQGRRRSKSFENGTPYLTGNKSSAFSRDNDTSLRDMKTSKIDVKNLQNEDYDQSSNSDQSFLSEFSTARRRQRSRTNPIVYIMNNVPIYPFTAQFSQVERNANLCITHQKDYESSVSKHTEHNGYMTDMDVKAETNEIFLRQAAQSATRIVNLENSKQPLKRSLAGSKTREEQNREKSKRYYDRNKAQNAAISKFFSKIESWCQTSGLSTVMMKEVQRLNELIKYTKSVADQGILKPSQKQKLIKTIQKDKEAAQMNMIVLSAMKINDLIDECTKEQINDRIRKYRDIACGFSNVKKEPLDMLNSGLFVWIDSISSWHDLILAEKRLRGKTEERSIFGLICTLSDLYV